LYVTACYFQLDFIKARIRQKVIQASNYQVNDKQFDNMEEFVSRLPLPVFTNKNISDVSELPCLS